MMVLYISPASYYGDSMHSQDKKLKLSVVTMKEYVYLQVEC